MPPTTPFLTALAPEARQPGSRDPLGLLPLWSRLGRTLIHNVTTVSGDLRGWTTLLITVGLVQNGREAGALDPQDREPLFRAEQLVAYSRVTHGSSVAEVRGLQRVRLRLHDHEGGRTPLRLGLARERRILALQQAAGVWGQISAAAEASGLLDRRRLCLCPPANALWRDTLWPRLAPYARRVTAILKDERGFAPAGDDADLAAELATLHEPALSAAEVALYRDHILNGATDGVQRQFVDLWRSAGLAGEITLPSVLALAARARERGLEEVALRLEGIIAAERLLGPVDRAFGWLLTRHGRTLDELAQEISRHWAGPYEDARHGADEILAPPVRSAYGDLAPLRLLGAAREALCEARWTDLVLALLELNAWITRRRGGAAWVRIESGRLDVRHTAEGDALPAAGDLRVWMTHSYYLDPLRRLARAWEEGQRA